MSLENASVGVLKLPEGSDPAWIGRVSEMATAHNPVILVVSAPRSARNSAIVRSNRAPASTGQHELAELMNQANSEAAERVAYELERAGVPAIVLDPAQFGPLTRGRPLDAEPRLIDARAYQDALVSEYVVVLPAGVGRDLNGQPTTLGEGGEDQTAVFLADRLAIPLEVVGWGADPGWSRKARVLATKSGVVLPQPERAGGPLRVALLGFGSVGAGVYRRLVRDPARYDVVGVALDSGDAKFAGELPSGLISFDGDEILSRDPDLVIDLSKPGERVRDSVFAAEARGIRVVDGTLAWKPRAELEPKEMVSKTA